jgi:methionyl-tRNA formyltransferase
MKIIFLTNNNDALNLAKLLIEFGESISIKDDKISKDDFQLYEYDFVISYGYRFIIKKDFIEKYDNRIINLHISYLPWNKGADPNLWSFLENTPKGVTIHLIDEGIDTGKILFQKQIEFDEEKETLKSSYDKLNTEIQDLFIKNWARIKRGDFNPQDQRGSGTIHYKKDFEKIKHILEPYGWEISIKLIKERYKKYLSI